MKQQLKETLDRSKATGGFGPGKKTLVKENSFDGAPGGGAGSVSSQPGLGTFSSPNVSQNSNQFGIEPNEMGVGNKSNAITQTQETVDWMKNALEEIFAKNEFPTVDEFTDGVKYELGRQLRKDKWSAKVKVVKNFLTNPHFYSELDQFQPVDTNKPRKWSVDLTKPTYAGSSLPTANQDEIKSIMKEMRNARMGRRM